MYPVEAGGMKNPGGWDQFHELIMHDELSRTTSGINGHVGIVSFSIPPLLRPGALAAAPDLLENVVKPCVRGEKCIALAISEPTAGSQHIINIITQLKLFSFS